MSKTRIDSWAAGLTEEQAWTLFYKARCCPWQVAAAWAAKEYNLARLPSRTGFYSWLQDMRSKEHEHRMGEAAIAAAEAAALGQKATKDEALIAAFKTLATEAALQTDAKTAVSFVQSAMAIQDQLRKSEELKVKSEELRLARDKFEFDAAKKAMENAVKIKTAAADDGLSTDEKIQKVREVLFG